MNENLLRLILPTKKAEYRTAHSKSDSDREIILPIVILLMAEKCDFFLVFSLLYILL